MNAAATWSYDLINARGIAMGQEHRGKGIDVQLGPVAGKQFVILFNAGSNQSKIGPIGRAPAGGRNWEGFSPDPVLTGVSMMATIEGIRKATHPF